ncbi:unnamed protein product [Closterium sp. NIES-54]
MGGLPATSHGESTSQLVCVTLSAALSTSSACAAIARPEEERGGGREREGRGGERGNREGSEGSEATGRAVRGAEAKKKHGAICRMGCMCQIVAQMPALTSRGEGLGGGEGGRGGVGEHGEHERMGEAVVQQIVAQMPALTSTGEGIGGKRAQGGMGEQGFRIWCWAAEHGSMGERWPYSRLGGMGASGGRMGGDEVTGWERGCLLADKVMHIQVGETGEFGHVCMDGAPQVQVVQNAAMANRQGGWGLGGWVLPQDAAAAAGAPVCVRHSQRRPYVHQRRRCSQDTWWRGREGGWWGGQREETRVSMCACTPMHSHARPCTPMHSHALPCTPMHSHALPCTPMHAHALPCTPMHSHANALPCTPMHSHALPCTPMHSHALPCTPMHAHALPCTPMHSHALPCTPMHSHALPCTPMHSHALPCTRMHAHALPCTPTHSHALPCTPTHSHALPCTPTHSHTYASEQQVKQQAAWHTAGARVGWCKAWQRCAVLCGAVGTAWAGEHSQVVASSGKEGHLRARVGAVALLGTWDATYAEGSGVHTTPPHSGSCPLLDPHTLHPPPLCTVPSRFRHAVASTKQLLRADQGGWRRGVGEGRDGHDVGVEAVEEEVGGQVSRGLDEGVWPLRGAGEGGGGGGGLGEE